ncbi:MAG: hypothetical protein ACPG4U_06690 [Pseudomonadales bacterium]
MSNIAGKAYAMNVVTPIRSYTRWINKLIFWAAQQPLFKQSLNGLKTLSLIHYARWAIIKPCQFPRLDPSQPKEDIKYSYMFFFSNFNGSWDQYVDSFHTAIPKGLDLFWSRNVKYPRSSPLTPFHRYINHNQIWTTYYYNAYPLASSNDVKSANKVRDTLLAFIDQRAEEQPELFLKRYNQMLLELQNDLSLMQKTPIVSLAQQAVNTRR